MFGFFSKASPSTRAFITGSTLQAIGIVVGFYSLIKDIANSQEQEQAQSSSINIESHLSNFVMMLGTCLSLHSNWLKSQEEYYLIDIEGQKFFKKIY